LKDIKDGTKKNLRIKSGDSIEVADLNSKPSQFLYSQGNTLHFLDNETLETFELNQDLIDEHTKSFLLEGRDVKIQFNGDTAIGIQLPEKMKLKVKETGGSVGDNTKFKPAVLEGGIVTQVPDYIGAGDLEPKIKPSILESKNE